MGVYVGDGVRSDGHSRSVAQAFAIFFSLSSSSRALWLFRAGKLLLRVSIKPTDASGFDKNEFERSRAAMKRKDRQSMQRRQFERNVNNIGF